MSLSAVSGLRRTRRSGLKVWALAAWLSGAACARASSTAPVASPAPAETTRRPPGVALDPPLVLPKAKATASTASGLVVLAAPVDLRPARKVVDAFFDAVVAQSIDRLERLFERNAHTRTGPNARAESAIASWRRRLERLDYTTLGSQILYRSSDVEIRTASDGRSRSMPDVPRGSEVMVRVPFVGATNTPKFFGNEVVFVLRPAAGGYKIGELFEDFRLP
jgi:hypothetical protein